jgi:hypothetical protein
MAKRAGRPTTSTPAGQKVTLSIRTTAGMKSRLADAAGAEGRNLSEEAERRLEDSFGRIENLFGGRAGFNVALMLYANFRFAGDQTAALHGHPDWTPTEWLRDPICFETALAELVRVVWQQHPKEDVTLRDYLDWLEKLHISARAFAASGFIAPEDAVLSEKEQG